mmetsp:Transcript_13607/g.32171  ORF Transcript_13607/g.32171 Transcript_13607/m.32171 type:complete len:200 (-) Transcript_13607:340-939(-)
MYTALCLLLLLLPMPVQIGQSQQHCPHCNRNDDDDDRLESSEDQLVGQEVFYRSIDDDVGGAESETGARYRVTDGCLQKQTASRPEGLVEMRQVEGEEKSVGVGGVRRFGERLRAAEVVEVHRLNLESDVGVFCESELVILCVEEVGERVGCLVRCVIAKPGWKWLREPAVDTDIDVESVCVIVNDVTWGGPIGVGQIV